MCGSPSSRAAKSWSASSGPPRAARSSSTIRAAQVAAEAERYDLFLVWGGDGTVGDVTTGLLGTGTPLGVLPAGTINNIACALGLPAQLDRQTLALVPGLRPAKPARYH